VAGDWNVPNEVWEEVNKETALDLGHLTQFASHAYRTAFGEKRPDHLDRLKQPFS
jgi:hypothetical protein